MLTRWELPDVAGEFTATGVVDLETVLEAMPGCVASIRAAGGRRCRHRLTDAIPFVPALMAWGHNEQVMTGFVDELAGLLRPVHPVIVYFGLELAGDREAREPAGEEAVWMLDFC